MASPAVSSRRRRKPAIEVQACGARASTKPHHQDEENGTKLSQVPLTLAVITVFHGHGHRRSGVNRGRSIQNHPREKPSEFGE